MFSRILFVADNSELAPKALEHALELAKRFHSEVYVVCAYVHVPEMLGAPTYDNLVAERSTEAKRILADTARTFEDAGLAVETELFDGKLAESVLNVAEARDCDLIVMGEDTMSALAELLLGSPGYHVIHHAKRPVLVIR